MANLSRLARKTLGRTVGRYVGVGARKNFLGSERYQAFKQAFRYTKNEEVEGDYVEFGVARGRTLIFAHQLMEKYPYGAGARLFGFDSFSGFPAPKGVDAEFQRFKQGEENHAIQEVQANIRRYGLDPTRIQLIPGWYEDTLNEATKRRLGLRRARVVNVDCDLYESSLAALRFVTDLVQSGTVLLFDDWFCYRGDPEKGEQAAMAQWLRETPGLEAVRYRAYANVGMSFIVTRRACEPSTS